MTWLDQPKDATWIHLSKRLSRDAITAFL